jgi:hypothetical protein
LALSPIKVVHSVHLGGNELPSLVPLNASEHYVGAWTPRVRGQALAEGEIPYLRCSMPQRVLVGLMYVQFHHSSYMFSLGSLRVSSD